MTSCPHCGEQNAEKARFCWSCGAALDKSHTAEVRKTVTVLFSDVVGSTALGEKADPESLRRLMTRYFSAISAVVERHGGVVEKYIGDAVMAVFGVPVLHEDDALRAVRAAAEMREEVARLGSELGSAGQPALEWRTGINTGEVVAGDAGARQRYVSGDAVNVAARLEQAAGPNEILLGAATYALVRDAVDVTPVRGVAAKGKTEPLDAYRLLHLTSRPSVGGWRLDAPMVGRRRQRRLLDDACEEVVEDHVCHLFTILGSAGVGKSRLVNEFLAGLDEKPLVLSGRCLSYGQGITYWPVAEIIRAAAGLGRDAGDPQVLDRIARLFGDERERAAVLRRLGGLLGVSRDDAGSGETAWAVRRMLEALARERPLVVIFDDLHWGESALLDLVDGLAESLSDAPVLLVCVARRELLDARPDWGGGKPHATSITLEPLSEQESRSLVANLFGQTKPGDELTVELAERITAAAEGNPLFVEEMLGMLVDGGLVVQQDGTWRTVGEVAELTVPAGIQALLAARIDALEAGDRLVLERAAVEGKTFHQAAVTALAPPDLQAEVPERLTSLSRRGIVRAEPSEGAHPEDAVFRFRHLLMRDAAYAGIPKSTRADLHGAFAAWMEQTARERMGELEEILGHHYQQAHRYRAELGLLNGETLHMGRLGARHLGIAGRRALDRGDAVAAHKLLNAAGELLPEGDPSRTRLRSDMALALRISAGPRAAADVLPSTIAAARAAGDEAGAAYAELILASMRNAANEATLAETLERCESSLRVLASHGDEEGVDRATIELALCHFWAGRAAQAEQLLVDRMALRTEFANDSSLREWLITTMSEGPRPAGEAIARMEDQLDSAPTRATEAACLIYLGHMRGYLGQFDEARGLVRDAIAIVHDLGGNVMRAGDALQTLGEIELLAGNPDEASRLVGQALDGMMEGDELGFAATLAGMLADVEIRRGDLERADQLVELVPQLLNGDDIDAQVRGMRARARILAARGDGQNALAIAQQAAEKALTTDYLILRGDTYTDLAEVELAVGDSARAVAALKHALSDYEQKGVAVLADEVEQRLAELGYQEPAGQPRG